MVVFYRVLGILLILFGIPVFWLPIPIGAIMIAIGLALVLANSSTARSWLHDWRERHEKADRWLAKMERKTPPPFRHVLEKTDGHGARDYANGKD